MLRQILKRKPAVIFATGIAAGLLVGIGMLVGSLVTRSSKGEFQMTFGERPVSATASHGSKKFAMATGRVGSDTEGVFMLDFLTGDMQCLVIYPRTGKVQGKFVANVARDLTANATAVRGKDPDYLIVTGQTSFNNRAVSPCVVYVADANTGNYVIYGLPWDRNAVSNGRSQAGTLRVITKGTARNIPIDN